MKKITPAAIYTAISAELGITDSFLHARSARRSNDLTARAKQIAAYMLKLHTDLCLKDIAASLGFDSKQYVSYCLKKTIESSGVDMDLRLQLARIEVRMLSITNDGIPEPKEEEVRKVSVG